MKKKFIFSIIIAILIIVVIAGATFAYWQWMTSEEEETSISLKVEGDTSNMSAKIDGGSSIDINSLIPTSNCLSSDALQKEITITYINNTDISGEIIANLDITSFTANNGNPTNEQLSYLKWVITNTENSCTTGIIQSGDFSNVDYQNLPQNLITIQNNISSNISTETQIQPLYLYIWLDSAYEHINIGNNNTDSMQNLNFTLEWSGIIRQLG